MERIPRSESSYDEEKPIEADFPQVDHIATFVDEIDRMGQPLFRILKELKESINNDEYALIIGDDSSGRLPALVVWKILKELSQEHGSLSPKLRFIAGSKRASNVQDKEGLIDEYLDKILTNFDLTKKVLLVSDMIDSGASLEPLVRSLSRHGVRFDIATLATVEEDRLNSLAEKWQAKIFFGQIGTPSIFKRQDLSGYIKDDNSLHAKPVIRNEAEQKYFREYVRRDVNIAASRLTKYYKKFLA